MVQMFVWFGVMVALGLVVLLFASVVERSEAPDDGRTVGLRGFWTDFRRGVRRARRREQEQADAAATPSSRPVDTSLDELLAATQVDRPAYVDAEELSDIWHQARARAARTMHVPVRGGAGARGAAGSGDAGSGGGPVPGQVTGPVASPGTAPADHDRTGAPSRPTRSAHPPAQPGE